MLFLLAQLPCACGDDGGHPDLGNLGDNGNMRFTTEFRGLYATILERWLGQATSTTDSLLGSAYARLGFL